MEPEITDIFDRIMNWKLLRFMWPFYKKNKDKLLYLFFGGCTTLVNLVITYGLWYGLKWEQWYAGKFALPINLFTILRIMPLINSHPLDLFRVSACRLDDNGGFLAYAPSPLLDIFAIFATINLGGLLCVSRMK